MPYTTVFKRYEIKYILTEEEYRALLPIISCHMHPDHFGNSTVRSLYFDTWDDRLIRRSMEKPVYKEKLRLRSYATADAEDGVFVELKKKYRHVVYKRRLFLSYGTAMEWLSGKTEAPFSTQIAREISYFLSYYGPLRPAMLLFYDREAFVGEEGDGLRLTLDRNVLAKTEGLSLSEQVSGTPLLEEGRVLMEVKCNGGMPLWLVRALSERGIYKTSFSKYGTAYTGLVLGEKYKKG